ncbi:MAG TPA: beta-xylosidase [Anaerolineae bacterium]|nr:beta-xylosidase [Anaerolineae bacterium]
MKLTLDVTQPGSPLTPYWKVCVGGGRVGEALRADFQKHLAQVQAEAPFDYIRMHGLFHEDMMVYREQGGKPIFNWQYVDLVYDHWLSVGIRPFVELSFMPYDLASGDQTIFWWRGNVTPPKDWQKWEQFITRFVRHLIARYGAAEVRRWYFEVWNEPNLSVFWQNADFDAYMTLYERTVNAIKAVDAQLRVGGPASAGFGDKPGVPPWGERFLMACAARGLPLDFFSTHPYPTLHPVDLEGHGYMIWDRPERLLTDLRGTRDLVQASDYPNAEIHLTEWSSSPSPRDRYHDTAFMAPFIIHNNWMGRGYADSLSFWVVSDIFEEGRQGDTPFHGGFGLINVQGLKKPSYHGYALLARLGEEVLQSGETYAITRHPGGKIAALFWNYCHYNELGQDSRATETGDLYRLFEEHGVETFDLALSGLGQGRLRVQTTVFDREHGSVYDAWLAMGSPDTPTHADLTVLRQQMELPATVQRLPVADGRADLHIAVAPHGVTLVELQVEETL